MISDKDLSLFIAQSMAVVLWMNILFMYSDTMDYIQVVENESTTRWALSACPMNIFDLHSNRSVGSK